ncbi:MAG: hypothetical protein M3552_22520, partial [Planctomycetota bacterium]|nr:hypothetical protein [Planctomycetota bacterium]
MKAIETMNKNGTRMKRTPANEERSSTIVSSNLSTIKTPASIPGLTRVMEAMGGSALLKSRVSVLFALHGGRNDARAYGRVSKKLPRMAVERTLLHMDQSGRPGRTAEIGLSALVGVAIAVGVAAAASDRPFGLAVGLALGLLWA